MFKALKRQGKSDAAVLTNHTDTISEAFQSIYRRNFELVVQRAAKIQKQNIQAIVTGRKIKKKR